MEDYSLYTDEQLIRCLREGNDPIMDYLLKKYKPLVRKKANALYLIGGETEDLIQEGMIGLFKAIRDYKEDTRKDLKTGEVTKTGLPASNVLYYELSDNAWCCVRPSGTEPKIKFYYGVKGTSLQDAEEKLEALKKDLVEE